MTSQQRFIHEVEGRRRLTAAQLDAAESLAYWLNKTRDADLAQVNARLRVVIFDIPEIKNATYIEDPDLGRVRAPLSAETRMLIGMISMVEEEMNRRQAVLQRVCAALVDRRQRLGQHKWQRQLELCPALRAPVYEISTHQPGELSGH